MNNDFIGGFLRAGKKDGLDIKTMRGMLLINITQTYSKAKKDWDYAKTYYIKKTINLTSSKNLRHCLNLTTNEEITKCTNSSK